ncbi:MAG: ammonia-forming cytochrome c nitrite reductase subunit c552 [Promethearchaeota archaeon]
MKSKKNGGILMNDQEEILVRQSKWNGRRVVLLYWFAIVFIGTATAAGVGAGVLNPKYQFKVEQYTHDDKFGDGTIWHPEECATCHPAEYEGWNQTLHSYLFAEYNESYLIHYSGTYQNTTAFLESKGCCHVTNWYNDTSVDPSGELKVWDYGVTCAACHEDPDNGFDPVGYMPFGPASYPCGGYGMKGMPLCHIPRGVSQFDMIGPHSQALDDLLASDDIDDSCLHCMTGNGLVYGYGPGENKSYEYGELIGIECYVCHNPMGVSNELYKEDKYPNLTLNSTLRANSIPELCGECHSGDYDSSYAMITDTTVQGPHSNFDCTQCHGYYLDPATESQNASFELNHTWTLKLPDACATCHLPTGTNMSALNATIMATTMESRMELLEGIQEDIAALVDTVETEITATTTKADEAAAVSGADEDEIAEIYLLIEEAKALVEFVEADPAGGFHNPDLTEVKLQLALTKLSWAKTAAEAIITPPGTTTEEPLTVTKTTHATETITETTTAAATAIGILAVLSILSATVLFQKKRR